MNDTCIIAVMNDTCIIAVASLFYCVVLLLQLNFHSLMKVK